MHHLMNRFCTAARRPVAALLLLGCAMIATRSAIADDPPREESGQSASTQQPTAESRSQTRQNERLFTLKVLPLLRSKCWGCHAEDLQDLKGDFGVHSLQALIDGGESDEPGIVPGDTGEGTLLQAIRWDGLEMPPKENDRLTAQQIEYVEAWIRGGAAWPDAAAQAAYIEEENQREETDEGIRVVTSGGTSQQWTNRRYQRKDLWA
ncbi:MAG: c-type cytochrome domain-containing protein, partial [Planctomycetota bacterium]